jgi:hypothetical protein
MQAIDYIFIIKHPGSVPRNDYPDSAALLLGMLSELSEIRIISLKMIFPD